MRIQFGTQESSQNVDRSKTVYETERTRNDSVKGGYSIDISGTVMDNNAYAGHGRTAEDVKRETEGQDVSLMRDYLTVMSNSLSDEDFAKLQQGGFSPSDMDAETVVTIVDKIKTVLAQSGHEIAGYNDDLDMEVLTAVTGNRGLAGIISDSLKEHDAPVTKDAAAQTAETVKEVGGIAELSDGALKYMVENGMHPTPENLYKAQFSGAADAAVQAKGYYASEKKGYLAKKAEEYNWEQLKPQMEQVIEEAGLSDVPEAAEESKWLIEKGVPLTAETLTLLHKIKSLEFPLQPEKICDAAAIALSDGKEAKKADLSETETAAEKAVFLKEDVDKLTEEAADLVTAQGKLLNLRNLRTAQRTVSLAGYQSVSVSITARRQLEEVRLQMTVTANVRLIKSGYAVETAPLEQLVEALKQAEQEENRILFQGNSQAENTYRSTLYADTIQTLYRAAAAPAAVIGTIALSYESATLTQVASYEKAGEAYETLMTEVRPDLGDSIKKAFRNVEDILTEMGLEQTEGNARAVRILGYNSMEITQENISAVKLADTGVQEIIKKMTPAAVLQMIRDGKNPLTMQMGELEEYLNGQEENAEPEKYSRFLYKLEQNHQITEDEKESYIGIYRMLRQLEKNDGAVIGSLLAQGVPVTFTNLMTALRSSKKSGMDYSVDDSFAGVSGDSSNKKNIGVQIETSYLQKLTKKLYQNLSPEQISILRENDDITLESLAESGMQNEKELSQEQPDSFRQMKHTEEEVLHTLLSYGQTVTADNLTAAESMLYKRGAVWNRFGAGKGRKETVEKISASLTEAMTSAADMEETYQKVSDTVKDAITKQIFSEAETSVNVKEMTLLHKQITFRASMAKEENYEIPVYIGTELTAVNLKIIHSPKDGGKVAVTLQSEILGKTAAEFRTDGDSVTGYIACDTEAGKEKLNDIAEVMNQRIEEAGYTECSISTVISKELRLTSFEQKEMKNGGYAKSSEQSLYQVAKLFLTSLQRLKGR